MKTLITQIVMAFATLVAITACSESNEIGRAHV